MKWVGREWESGIVSEKKEKSTKEDENDQQEKRVEKNTEKGKTAFVRAIFSAFVSMKIFRLCTTSPGFLRRFGRGKEED